MPKWLAGDGNSPGALEGPHRRTDFSSTAQDHFITDSHGMNGLGDGVIDVHLDELIPSGMSPPRVVRRKLLARTAGDQNAEEPSWHSGPSKTQRRQPRPTGPRQALRSPAGGLRVPALVPGKERPGGRLTLDDLERNRAAVSMRSFALPTAIASVYNTWPRSCSGSSAVHTSAVRYVACPRLCPI